MILIDAIYINNGGGKVLLDYLMGCLEATDVQVFYLLDSRIENANYKVKQTNRIKYIPASLSQRQKFYDEHKNTFSKVFILGNIPPLKKINAEVYTYFHNAIYIEVPKDFSWIEKIKYKLKVGIIKYASRNTDYWLVQSPTLKDQFVKKFSQAEKIKILPFFPEMLPTKNVNREKHTFLYVSNAQANKNHIRLMKGFCDAYDELQRGKLVVTVSDAFPQVLKEIQKLQAQGYPIENRGFMDRERLIETYQKSEYVIFPSLSESFGLGLVEGISLGCKVIGADLPYTYAVCQPSLVFNPMDAKNISEVIKKALSEELVESQSKVKNQIKDLVNLLS